MNRNFDQPAAAAPVRRARAVPTEEVLAIFANVPVIDPDELRADLDEFIDPEARDPYEGTGL